MNWVEILGSISIWIILVPLFIGIAGLKNLDDESKLILLIVGIGTIPQVFGQFIINTSAKNVLYNLYTPLEFIAYLFLFKIRIYSYKLRFLIKITAVLFFAISIILIVKNGLTSRFINEWVIANNLIQIIWVSLCLLELYYHDESVIEKKQPFFWYLTGITCYSSCTVVFYSLWFFIKKDEHSQYHVLVIIHHFFNILIYCLFSIGLFQNFNLSKKNAVSKNQID